MTIYCISVYIYIVYYVTMFVYFPDDGNIFTLRRPLAGQQLRNATLVDGHAGTVHYVSI